jgi:hypothetical protein
MSTCPGCGTAVTPGARFCSTCGAEQPPAVPPAPPPAPRGSSTPATGSTAPANGSEGAPSGGSDAAAGVLGGFLVLVVSAAVVLVGWPVLGLPARLLGSVVPAGDCISEVPGTRAMYLCSARVGFLTALGPILVAAAAVLFRKPLATLVRRATAGRVPPGARFLVGPALATALFTMVYAELHRHTADDTGLVPQRVFPIVAGLFMHLVARTGPSLNHRIGGFLDVRDRVPVPLRIVLALALPLGLALLITNEDRVSDPARKEQIVILSSLATGYLAVVPRSGDLRQVLRSVPTLGESPR